MAAAQVKVRVGEGSWLLQGRGRRRTISKSNNRKRIATKKNRSEKGSRADPRGSNPHSYGESFSWSGFIWGSQKETRARIIDRAVVIIITIVSKFIIFPWILTKTLQLEVACTI